MSNLWIDIGRFKEERVGFDFSKERGIGIAGYCGVGKTNLVYRILSKLIEQRTEEEVEIYLYVSSPTYIYRQFTNKFPHIVEFEDKLHKIRAGLNKIVKEIERRKKKLEKWNRTYEEVVEQLDEKEREKWKEKYVVIDNYSVHLIDLRKKVKDEQYKKYVELTRRIAEEGAFVGIKPIYVFLRTCEYDCPSEVAKHLSVLGSFLNPEKDYELWGLVKEGVKLPKKVGEMLLRTSQYVGFAKTYKIETYVENREGVFNKWDPYRELYQEILNKLK